VQSIKGDIQEEILGFLEENEPEPRPQLTQEVLNGLYHRFFFVPCISREVSFGEPYHPRGNLWEYLLVLGEDKKEGKTDPVGKKDHQDSLGEYREWD